MVTYVINRDARKDRLDSFRKEITLQGINAKRFPAIENKVGYIGCRDSHLELLAKIPPNDYMLILEDDVTFVNDFDYLAEAVSQAGKEWDAIYLGGSPRKPQERYSDNLFKANGVYTTHSILWHNRPNGAVEYILSHKQDIGKIDCFMASTIQPLFNVYMTYPIICSQYQSQSDTCKRADLSTIVKNYNAFCK